MTDKKLSELTIEKSSTNDLDTSGIDTKRLVINHKENKKFNLKISNKLKYLETDFPYEISVYCDDKVTVEITKHSEIKLLQQISFINFFGLIKFYDSMMSEQCYTQWVRKHPEDAADIPKFHEMNPDQQNEYRIFVSLVKDLEVLEFDTESYDYREKNDITETPQQITIEMKLKNLSYCEINTTGFDCLNLPTSLTELKMKDLSESTFEFDDINIITLKLYECRNIKIYLNTTLKNLYVENGYGGDFECRKGVIYLTSFDSFHSGRYNSKNIVVDYLIPYKETVEQGPAWADSVVYSFNYMKGMYFVEQGFSSSEVAWSNPDPTGKPTYPANIYAERACYKCDVSYVWFKAVKEIGDFCFAESVFREKRIEIPEQMTTFGIGAFYKAANLESVKLPKGFKKLPYKAFYGAKDLTEITSPESEIKIDDYTLFGCKKLEIYPKFIPTKTATFCDGYLVKFCHLKSIEVRSCVTEIKRSNYANCNELTEIILPNNVTYIADYAFVGCTNLKNIVFNENVVFGKHLVFTNMSKILCVK
ncbi:hypothetical protein EIN_478150, partial [Entamoeba invadens IP1]